MIIRYDHSPLSTPILFNGREDFLVGRHPLFGKYDLEIGADDINCPLDQLAHRLQGFVPARDFLIGIGQNCKREAFFVAVIIVRFDRGRIYSQNFGSGFGEFILVRLKGGKLTVSPRSVVFGIEYQYGIFGFPFRQGDLSSAGTIESKINSVIADFQHQLAFQYFKLGVCSDISLQSLTTPAARYHISFRTRNKSLLSGVSSMSW